MSNNSDTCVPEQNTFRNVNALQWNRRAKRLTWTLSWTKKDLHQLILKAPHAFTEPLPPAASFDGRKAANAPAVAASCPTPLSTPALDASPPWIFAPQAKAAPSEMRRAAKAPRVLTKLVIPQEIPLILLTTVKWSWEFKILDSTSSRLIPHVDS